MPLSDCERAMAETAGVWRAERVFRERLGAGHGEASRDFQAVRERHVLGVLGELAVSKALGRYFDPSPEDFGRWGDVGGLEVRTTGRRDGHLIAFPSDPDDRTLVLAIVEPEGSARIAGRILAKDARRVEYRELAYKHCRPSSPPQWWVPQFCLEPFERPDWMRVGA